jgi:hypothetical protein
MDLKIICWHCKNEVEMPEKAARTDECPECETPLKCCFHCKFYDKLAFHQCVETQAEWVRYKEKANFCDYFQANFLHLQKPKEKPLNTPEARKDAWNDLFDE